MHKSMQGTRKMVRKYREKHGQQRHTKQQWHALHWKVMKDGQIHSLRVSSQKRNNQLWLCLSLSLIMHIQDFATMLQIRGNNIGCRCCRRITPKLQSFLWIIVLQLLATISSLFFLPPHRVLFFYLGTFYCSLNIVSDTWDHPLFISLLPALLFLSLVFYRKPNLSDAAPTPRKSMKGMLIFSFLFSLSPQREGLALLVPTDSVAESSEFESDWPDWSTPLTTPIGPFW